MEINSEEILESLIQASSIGSQVESQPMNKSAWGRLYGVKNKFESVGKSLKYRITCNFVMVSCSRVPYRHKHFHL